MNVFPIIFFFVLGSATTTFAKEVEVSKTSVILSDKDRSGRVTVHEYDYSGDADVLSNLIAHMANKKLASDARGRKRVEIKYFYTSEQEALYFKAALTSIRAKLTDPGRVHFALVGENLEHRRVEADALQAEHDLEAMAQTIDASFGEGTEAMFQQANRSSLGVVKKWLNRAWSGPSTKTREVQVIERVARTKAGVAVGLWVMRGGLAPGALLAAGVDALLQYVFARHSESYRDIKLAMRIGFYDWLPGAKQVNSSSPIRFINRHQIVRSMILNTMIHAIAPTVMLATLYSGQMPTFTSDPLIWKNIAVIGVLGSLFGAIGDAGQSQLKLKGVLNSFNSRTKTWLLSTFGQIGSFCNASGLGLFMPVFMGMEWAGKAVLGARGILWYSKHHQIMVASPTINRAMLNELVELFDVAEPRGELGHQVITESLSEYRPQSFWQRWHTKFVLAVRDVEERLRWRCLAQYLGLVGRS